MKSARAAFLTFLFLGLLTSPALAQDPAASTIAGTVTDAAGAPVAGAQVTAVRRATGQKRETTSAPSGTYTFTNLPPGEYTVTVSAAALPPVTYEHVRTEVGRLLDLPLRLVAATGKETLTVSGAPPLAIGRSVVEDVIAATAIENLPLERPQLPGAGVPRARQRARAELRSDQDEQHRGLVRRPARPRRQHHDRRPGQQRRRRGRPAREPAAGRRPGVPDRHQPLLGRAGPVGGVRDQRGHEVAAPTPSRGSASFFLRDDALQGLPATYDRDERQTPSFDRQQYSVGARRSARQGQGLVVRGRGVPQPGRGRAGRRRDAGGAHHPPRASRSAPLDDVLATGRIDVRASAKRRPRASATPSRTRRTPGPARSTAPSDPTASGRRATTVTTWAWPPGRGRSRPRR